MTEATYTALTECARQRISREWRCSVAEVELLNLITDLSYAIGQSWCVVPCLADFAAACGIHKSTASRALRSACQKGYLQILSRQGETLYSVITTTRATEADEEVNKRREAKQRLVEINQKRLQGQADADGQTRLPGVYESEEIEAPAAAFEAMLEQVEPVTEATPPQPADEPLARLLATMERQREAQEGKSCPKPPARRAVEAPPSSAARSFERPAERLEVGSFAAQWQEMTRGLSDQAVHCLQQIRTECQYRKGAEAQFFQWRWKWRQRAQKQTLLYLEAAGVCKALRLEQGSIAENPGAFIYRSVQYAEK